MNLEEMKQNWKASPAPSTSEAGLRGMMEEKNHPVLKKIRRQLSFEIVAWAVFLLCYYTMFDGDRKPFWVNGVLVGAVLASILYNMAGYRFSKQPVTARSLRDSLADTISRMKKYTVGVVLFRVVFIMGLAVFFTYGVSFTTGKWMVVGGALVVLAAQLWWLYSVWAKRAKHLQAVLSEMA